MESGTSPGRGEACCLRGDGNLMELTLYLTPLIKRWRLIAVSAAIAGIVTLIIAILSPSVYEARTTLMIGQSIANPNPSSNQFYLEQDLAKIYADIALREPIRRATMQALGLADLPEYSVSALPNQQLIEIVVRDRDPLRAQTVATELATQLIRQTPTQINTEDQERQQFVEDQLVRLQDDIEASQDEITALEARLGEVRGAREIGEIERQISALDDKVASLQASYAGLLAGTPTGAVNSLAVIDPAGVPRRPIGPSPLYSALLAAVLGAAVAVAGIYLMEFLDRRVNHPHELAGLLGWPILGQIEEAENIENLSDYLATHPYSNLANSFRALRSNLELAGLGKSIKTLVVTSPAVGDGKSMVATHLSQVLAIAKRRVILVDGDLQRPRPKYVGERGLSDSLIEDADPLRSLVETEWGTLTVLPAGTLPEQALGLMDSAKVADLFFSLRESADVVIVDGPPTFISDLAILAAGAEGVLAVVRMGATPWDAVKEMRTRLQTSGVPVLGVVVNGVTRSPGYASSYYREETEGATEVPDAADGAQAGSRWERLRSHAWARRIEHAWSRAWAWVWS